MHRRDEMGRLEARMRRIEGCEGFGAYYGTSQQLVGDAVLESQGGQFYVLLPPQ